MPRRGKRSKRRIEKRQARGRLKEGLRQAGYDPAEANDFFYTSEEEQQHEGYGRSSGSYRALSHNGDYSRSDAAADYTGASDE